ncbi:MAG: 3-oxoacyl-(Acyl-carrier-protein) reductase [Rickettsiaceae bacterium]|jgi:3-oxoacyl-[acyl-carrier protein] reductase|nr:3-oxoacyl-(Acyl-carrier-protein) reductase [Rickettsiaceae bacterium]
MFNLQGKKALVTGASGGIGKEIAKSLSAAGAVVVLSGTKEEKLREVAKEISGESHIIPCNLSNIEEVEALFDKAEAAMGQVDILVCNAGVTKDGLVLRMKNEDWDEVLNINLKSTFILNRNAIKKMMRRKWGRIINLSSVVGVSGNPGQANYVASKAGMIGMSKSFAMEVASRGITVNCIAPGFIATNMTDVLTDAQKEGILSAIPAGKMGSPSDIASGAVFLASEEASYITGQTLHINGGMLMV